MTEFLKEYAIVLGLVAMMAVLIFVPLLAIAAIHNCFTGIIC